MSGTPSAFGLSPLGEGTGPFGGTGMITVLGALPSGENTFIVVFDREPKRLDDQGMDSGINPENYVLAAVDPTVATEDGGTYVPPGSVVPTISPTVVAAWADAADPKQIHLATDVNLERGVEYSVLVEPSIVSVDGDVFAGPQTWTFYGRNAPPTLVVTQIFEERYRDIATRVAPDEDGEAGYYEFDANGDLAIQSASASLRKRIIRRVFTNKNGFVFLRNYGVGVNLKALARRGELQRLSSAIAEQVSAEPDVADVAVTVRTQESRVGLMVIVNLSVLQTNSQTSKFTVEVPVS